MSIDLVIRQLSEETLEDFFAFFESVEFKEHPHWSVCYCYSFHFTGPAAQWNRENNRSAVRRLVSLNQMKGYLAYHQGTPVGWCNVNNRLNYQRLVKLHELIEPQNNRTCSIVCFLVHPGYRRRGVSGKLLDQIIQDYRSLDIDWIEAYPGKGVRTCEGLYKGPLDLYLRYGFEIAAEQEDHYVVRKCMRKGL